MVPSDTTLVIERFRDEIGDWRVAIVHSPFGMPVHAPWALCIAARMRERYGVDVQAMAADDGIVLRLPDVEFDDGADAGLSSSLLFLDSGRDRRPRHRATSRLGALRLALPRVRRPRVAAAAPPT
jgi:ATP-dependent Lhr-like helicase